VYLEAQADESWRAYGHGFYAPTLRGKDRLIRRVRLGDYSTLMDAQRAHPDGKVLSAPGCTVLGVVLPE
jgi:hypothetical protein